MGIIAWIVLGLGAGLLANMLIPRKEGTGPRSDLPDRVCIRNDRFGTIHDLANRP